MAAFITQVLYRDFSLLSSGYSHFLSLALFFLDWIKGSEKCGPPLVFVNKVCLGHSHPRVLVRCLWMLSGHNSRVERWVRGNRVSKPKIFTAWSLTDKLARPSFTLSLCQTHLLMAFQSFQGGTERRLRPCKLMLLLLPYFLLLTRISALTREKILGWKWIALKNL